MTNPGNPSPLTVRQLMELGVDINPDKLYFVQTARHFPRAPHDIVNVFLYQLVDDETFSYQDSEVGGIEWHTLEDFKKMLKDPEAHQIVPMGDLYFGMLVAAFEHVAKLGLDT